MSATLSAYASRSASGHVNAHQPSGRSTGRPDPYVYDFGNRYSVPAEVRGGRVVRLDGKPYKG